MSMLKVRICQQTPTQYLFIQQLPLVLPVAVYTLTVEPKENGCSGTDSGYRAIHVICVPCSTAEAWT